MALPKFTLMVSTVFIYVMYTFIHHGWANYDQEKPLDYTGTIESAVFENPHATAKINLNKKSWTVILAPTSRMQERGIKPTMLKKGTTVRVMGYPHREIKDEMRAERIFIQDKKFELRR